MTEIPKEQCNTINCSNILHDSCIYIVQCNLDIYYIEMINGIKANMTYRKV